MRDRRVKGTTNREREGPELLWRNARDLQDRHDTKIYVSLRQNRFESAVSTHREPGFMHERRGRVPRLDLVAEDDLDLAGVLPARVEQRLEHAVDRQRDLCAERADVVHYTPPSSVYACGRRDRGAGARTEDFEGVRRVEGTCDDERAEAWLQRHGEFGEVRAYRG